MFRRRQPGEHDTCDCRFRCQRTRTVIKRERMPQLRKDPVLGRWVIIATERGKRPTDFAHEPEDEEERFLSVRRGQRGQDAARGDGLPRPPAPTPDTPGWKVRVVPNKFPALVHRGRPRQGRRGHVRQDERRRRPRGRHRDAGARPASFADLPVEHVALVLKAIQERMLDLQGDTQVQVHPGLPQPRERGGGVARAPALPAHRAADPARSA